MAKTRNILKHIRAVRNIRTVTKAMQAVAAARFKAAHDRVTAFSPFGARLTEMLGDVVAQLKSAEWDHPLLRAPEDVRREVLLVLTSDRGLCGSYNTGVTHLAMQRLGQLTQGGYEVELHLVGRRGARYLKFRGLEIDEIYQDLSDLPEYREVAALADRMMGEFGARRISGLEVVYTQFVSTGQQRPAIAQILPVSDLPAPREADLPEDDAPCDFWPSPEEILRKLLPLTVRLKLYQCFIESGSAEQFTRRTAMRAATDNADDMVRELKILANRQRQKQITTELSEIMGGRAGNR